MYNDAELADDRIYQERTYKKSIPHLHDSVSFVGIVEDCFEDNLRTNISI